MASKMTGFCKNEDCPTSNELLAFENGDLERGRATEVRAHLRTCEFCESEVEFYATYPQASEETVTETAEIPAPLFELAEALLKNRSTDHTSLNSLLQEKGGIVLDRS